METQKGIHVCPLFSDILPSDEEMSEGYDSQDDQLPGESPAEALGQLAFPSARDAATEASSANSTKVSGKTAPLHDDEEAVGEAAKPRSKPPQPPPRQPTLPTRPTLKAQTPSVSQGKHGRNQGSKLAIISRNYANKETIC